MKDKNSKNFLVLKLQVYGDKLMDGKEVIKQIGSCQILYDFELESYDENQ